MLELIRDNIVLAILGINCLLTVLMVVMTAVNLATLKSINRFIAEQLDVQAKVFKLIRYRRSQELLDFLNKRVDRKVTRLK